MAKKGTRRTSRKTKGGKKGFRLFGITARVLMLVAAGALMLTYASVLFNPAHIWLMTVFGLLFLPMFLLNLFLLVWAIARRSRSFFIPLLALLPSLLVIGSYFQFSNSSDAGPEGVRIVSYNTGRFAQYTSRADVSSRSECMDSVVAFLKRQDADIICLQEFYVKNDASLKALLAKQFPGYHTAYYVYNTGRGLCGNVTLSRYQIVDKGKFDFESSSNLAVYTDLRIGADKVRLYNCHFESYNISIPRLIKAVGARDDEELQKTEEKMRRSITRRPQQVDKVLKDILHCDVETMVAGDFNDTPMSYTYHKLRKGHKDSFVEAGVGFGGTYSMLRPFLRIDYILFPERYKASTHTVPTTFWSDHLPIITEIHT